MVVSRVHQLVSDSEHTSDNRLVDLNPLDPAIGHVLDALPKNSFRNPDPVIIDGVLVAQSSQFREQEREDGERGQGR